MKVMPRMTGRIENTTSQYRHVPHLVCSLPKSDATTPAQDMSCVIAGRHNTHLVTWVAIATSTTLALANVKKADHTLLAWLLLETQRKQVQMATASLHGTGYSETAADCEIKAVAMAAILTEEHEDEDAQLQRGDLRLMAKVSELAALLRFPHRSMWPPIGLCGSLFCSVTCGTSIVYKQRVNCEGNTSKADSRHSIGLGHDRRR